MQKKLHLVFGTHNTIPVGAQEHVFESAYQQAFKPFLGTLYNFPKLMVTLHYSGTLLQWLELKHAEFIDVLSELVSRKQVELVGGGFFDPIFPLIPRSDRLGQIESLTTFLRKRFGKRPRGGWVTESVWEPSLASTFKNSGLEYVFLDDYAFKMSGCGNNEIFSPCVTEDQGKTLIIFPNNKSYESYIPFLSPEKAIEKMRKLKETGNSSVLTIMLDGMHLGCWNDTNKICYQQEWLYKFFSLILANKDWIELVQPQRFLKNWIPTTKRYFPCTGVPFMENGSNSYQSKKQPLYESASSESETTARRIFSGGRFFRQFLTTYKESNYLYSKMQYIHILVNQIRGDKYRKIAAQEELWRGQHHTPFWYGRDGGIYNNQLRKAMYGTLIEAEKVTREKGIFISSIITTDFDFDGQNELLFQGQDLNAYIHSFGGVLFELDYLPKSWNYLDTFTHYFEPSLNDSDSTDRIYDTYTRNSFIDHFFDKETRLSDFRDNRMKELGDFIHNRYEVEELKRERKEFLLRRRGVVSWQGHMIPFEIAKKYIFRKSSINVYYTVTNFSSYKVDMKFGVEFNFSFYSNMKKYLQMFNVRNNQRIAVSAEKMIEDTEVRKVLFEDIVNETTLTVSSSEPYELWSYPVFSNIRTMKGKKKIFQQVTALPQWEILFEPRSSWETWIGVHLDMEC